MKHELRNRFLKDGLVFAEKNRCQSRYSGVERMRDVIAILTAALLLSVPAKAASTSGSSNAAFLYVVGAGDFDPTMPGAFSSFALSSFRIDATTGNLAPLPGSPRSINVGSGITVVSSGPFVYVVGFPSSIEGFAINAADGSLDPLANSPFPLSGRTPVTAVVGGAGRFLYVPNNVSKDISAYSIDKSSGDLTPIPGEPFPAIGVVGSLASDPSGQFLYLATGGVTAALSVFRVNPTTGELTHVPGSPFPAQPGPVSLGVDPLGRFLYVVNEQTALISGFTVDTVSGVLNPLPDSPFLAGPRPLAITLDPGGRFVFVGNFSGLVSVFSVDGTTGALTPIPGSPFPSGFQPNSLVVDPSGSVLYVADPQGFEGPAFGTGSVWAHLIDPTGSLTMTSGSPFMAGSSPWDLATLESAISIDIDIKPGSDPNAINPAGSGLTPVAILTTDTFDATTVSPITVQFGPAGASLEHQLGHLADVDSDGDLDLVLHFRTQEAGIQCGDTEASLTGETFDGQAIQGSDGVLTVGCS